MYSTCYTIRLLYECTTCYTTSHQVRAAAAVGSSRRPPRHVRHHALPPAAHPAGQREEEAAEGEGLAPLDNASGLSVWGRVARWVQLAPGAVGMAQQVFNGCPPRLPGLELLP